MRKLIMIAFALAIIPLGGVFAQDAVEFEDISDRHVTVLDGDDAIRDEVLTGDEFGPEECPGSQNEDEISDKE